MKYKCENCNYETDDKSNFNKHLNSKAHAKRKNNILKVDPNCQQKLPSKFHCPSCEKNFSE